MSGARVWLRGVGVWTPAHAGFSAWIDAGMPDQLEPAPGVEPLKPSAELLHPRLRRRTSVLTRMLVTALAEACQQGGAQASQTRYVLVSSWGEIETTVELLAQIADGPVSPTAFHNSVHNTATGYMSIATGNHRESTALAAGPHALEIGLLEVCTGLRQTGGDALLLLGEERLPAPFARDDADPSFAVALHLAAEPGRPMHPTSLDLELELSERTPAPISPSERSRHDLRFTSHAVLPLLKAIAAVQREPPSTHPVEVPLAPRPSVDVGRAWSALLRRTVG